MTKGRKDIRVRQAYLFGGYVATCKLPATAAISVRAKTKDEAISACQRKVAKAEKRRTRGKAERGAA